MMQDAKFKNSSGVTVVVPTLNREGFLGPCLQDLLVQAYSPLEILVVDQSEAMPRTVQDLVAAYPDLITYHHVNFRGLPTARNYGWQQARYERIVFVDDDIRCSPELVAEHVRALDLDGVGAVAGGIDEAYRKETPGKRTGSFNRWTATPGRGFDVHGQFEVAGGRGCNFSVLREAIRNVGGFDEALNVGAALYEETDLFLRIGAAGYRVWFNSNARLTHLAASSGGCRVDQVEPYIYSLAHNRTVLIRRHTKFYHYPTAFLRLALLALSHAWAYRKPRVIYEALRGTREGFRASVNSPACSIFILEQETAKKL